MPSRTRPKIALIVPIRFAVRGFLESDVYPLLREAADLLIISPFAANESFVKRYSGNGVRHALLQHFTPSGAHQHAHVLLDKTMKRHWGFRSYEVIDQLRAYHNAYKERPPAPSMIWRMARGLWYTPIGINNRLGLAWLSHRERRLYEKQYDFSCYEELLAREQPDLVVSTSPNRPQEMPIARAAEKCHIPNIAYILSFDNICCYGPCPVRYDHYIVWNDRNKQELMHHYAGIGERNVTIAGPLQFDFYFRRNRYLVSRDQWASSLGVVPTHKVLLYAETGRNIAPHETSIVADLARRIRSLGEAGNVQLVVRSHPMYAPDWWDEVQREFPEIIFSRTNYGRGERSTFNFEDNVQWEQKDLALLVNSLSHGDVHWNVSSSMTLDAAYFDRPTVCVAYDPRPGAPFEGICRGLYGREHYVDIVRSGGAVIARSAECAWRATLAYLENPALHREERRRMLAAYDPFMDGKAAERTAAAILKCLATVCAERRHARRKDTLRRARIA